MLSKRLSTGQKNNYISVKEIVAILQAHESSNELTLFVNKKGYSYTVNLAPRPAIEFPCSQDLDFAKKLIIEEKNGYSKKIENVGE